METKNDSNRLHVRISRATEIVWEGEAVTVSARNSNGAFDILPLHAHFISILDDAPISIQEPSGAKTEYTFAHSVMHVRDNNVFIYANIV